MLSQHPYARAGSSLSVAQHPSRISSQRIRVSFEERPKVKPPIVLSTTTGQPFYPLKRLLAQHTSNPHFVKQESFITLSLSGHAGGDQQLVYAGGSLAKGLVTLSKTSNITSVDVKLEGSVRVRELQGGGEGASTFISDTLYVWDRNTQRDLVPTEFEFEARVPKYASVAPRQMLPPSYDSRLTAVPGFRITVQYEFVVSVVRRLAGPVGLWKRRTRLRVPFVYQPQTRPHALGPFPFLKARTSPDFPRTVFTDLVRSRQQYVPHIETEVFLPHSTVVPIGDRIPFRINLRAIDAYLSVFLEGASTLPSFLPLPSSSAPSLRGQYQCPQADSVTSLKTTRPPLFPIFLRDPSAYAPVRVWLERRIRVDARDTKVVVVGKIESTEVLAEGTLHRGERGTGWVSWWGLVELPPGLECGGFAAQRLEVQDELVFSIDSPGVDTHELPFRQRIPLLLTTHSARAHGVTRIS